METNNKKKYIRYTAEHLRHRNMRFWLCYLILVCLIVSAFSAVYKYFDANLTEYEAAQYTHIADEVSTIFTERRFDELYKYEDTSIDYLETEEDYVAYLNKLTEGSVIECKRVGTSDTSEIKYKVTADDKVFAEFTLRKTGEVKRFEVIPMVGYAVATDIYALDNITTSILQPVTYDYTVPSDAVISVNNRVIGAEYVVKEGIEQFFNGFLPEGYEDETLTAYRFTCALGSPDIIVTDAEGNTLEMVETEEDTFEYQFPYNDEELKPLLEDKAVEFVKLLCRYSTDNCKLSTILARVQEKSNAYTNINAIEEKWRTKADEYEFKDISTCNYAQFSDTICSCEVKLTYHTVSKKKENSYETAYRLYFVKTNSGVLVYDFIAI